MTNYDPTAAVYSEIHESRLVVAVELDNKTTSGAAAAPAGSSAKGAPSGNIGFWDSLSGGAVSRTVSPRKQPGKATVAKIPALHRSLSTLTLGRAWNSNEEDRSPIWTLIKSWANSPNQLVGMRVKITQLLMHDNGTFTRLESYAGPVVSYDPPRGNSEGENFLKEQLVIDPDEWTIHDDAPSAPGASSNASTTNPATR